MRGLLRSLRAFSVLFVLCGVFIAPSNRRTIDSSQWTESILQTENIADLNWKIRFAVPNAPSAPFAFVSTHGRDLVHGFHLTIDLYGNGFLVLTDVSTKQNSNQIVFLGHPITGEHTFEMRLHQSDSRIRWKTVNLFFDGLEIPFHSGDPARTLDLKNIDFAPDVKISKAQDAAPLVGEIISETITIKSWSEDKNYLTQIILFFSGIIGLVASTQLLDKLREGKASESSLAAR